MGTPTRLSVIATAALLSACVAPYKPDSVMRNVGYSESKRAPGVYQVWFVDEHTNEDRGADLAELRAAELCLGESKPFMHTSEFQRGTPRVRMTHNVRTVRTVRYGEVTNSPNQPTFVTKMVSVPGKQLYTTRSGLLVTCLPEKTDDAQEVAIVAASIRERYGIATKSGPQTPGS